MALSSTDIATGDLLVERRLISLVQLDEAKELAVAWNVRLGDVLLARSWLKPRQFYETLAGNFDLPFVDLLKQPPDETLMEESDAETFARHLIVPWMRRNGRLVVATADPGPDAILFARRRWGGAFDLVVTSKFDIIWSLQSRFREQQSHDAVYQLAEIDPDMSAQRVVTVAQLIAIYACLSLVAVGLAFAPIATLIGINLVMTLFYLGNFAFKALLVWAGGVGQARSTQALEAEARLLHDRELPTYTILVPMFREPEVLPILANALRRLDYPLAKLDIKLVLEEGDHETIDAAKALALEGIFEIIRVPASQPQTKPKACNYALKFARGEFLVIYDAEDKPEPDQLKKVVAAFRSSPDNTACIQCRLNYYNARENWLTRMFTLDYSLWFDMMLPGLERLKVPIPLGGTSNHFRIDVLRELHAWDPFNVTEDADLGIRMTQKGYRVGVIDSTTFEEANCATGNWIRQRSRWIKGYMQTFLVHTRRPVHLVRSIGVLGVIGFLFFIGGTMLSGLLNPLFWLIFVAWLVTSTSGFDILFPPLLLYFALFNLLAGNGLFIYLTMVAPFRRGWLELVPYGLSVFWYWMLTSVAAYKALWQLISNPFYWEKTQHGISKHTAIELAKAKAESAAEQGA
ncbi:glycosyltransferase family 2 protein [Amorphus coralli]|uniref:glycosyltransferase family 2 protein n=1 Tax=Amorphus coralli TaxID=340680 RepID=UPI000371D2DE|nr:glycosyltransferase family 2 protein [Amorphus coralli]